MRGYAGALSVALLLIGCQQPRGTFGFEVGAVQLHPGRQAIRVNYDPQLQLSREASEALAHGVPLTITLDLELRDAGNLTLLAAQEEHFTVRYLPLSRHYQLSGPEADEVHTFPRLRHALAEIGDTPLEFRTGALAPGTYEFRIRIRLNNGRMPAPMRLPALLSAQWRHDSEWSTWPFVIRA